MSDELDPNGKDQHQPGAKLDQGKNRLGLVLGSFSKALCAVGEIGTFGANKYTDNGWKEVPDGQARYTDAMLRHYMKEAQGEKLDPDSTLMHSAHLAWNALARLELELTLDEEPQLRMGTVIDMRGPHFTAEERNRDLKCHICGEPNGTCNHVARILRCAGCGYIDCTCDPLTDICMGCQDDVCTCESQSNGG